MLESLFNKLAALRFATLLKRDSNAGVSCEICKTFKNIFFYRTLPASASGLLGNFQIFMSVLSESLLPKLPVTFPEIF